MQNVGTRPIGPTLKVRLQRAQVAWLAGVSSMKIKPKWLRTRDNRRDLLRGGI